MARNPLALLLVSCCAVGDASYTPLATRAPKRAAATSAPLKLPPTSTTVRTGGSLWSRLFNNVLPTKASRSKPGSPSYDVRFSQRSVAALKPAPRQDGRLRDRGTNTGGTYSHEYWFDPRMHSWGNTGLRGAIHAFFAPLATYIIDQRSYSGIDVRSLVHSTLPADATVLDLCCGTGFSAVPGATCVDTSEEMLRIARVRRPDCTFEQGNAESYGRTCSFDVVTVMFAMHEAPLAGRRCVAAVAPFRVSLPLPPGPRP